MRIALLLFFFYFSQAFSRAQGLVPDTLFGSNGLFRAPSGFVNVVNTFRLSDNKWLCVGSDGIRMALQRIKSCGSMDSSFGTNGRISTAHLESSVFVAKAALSPDGKIYLAGRCRKSNLNFDLPYLIRFNANGSVDETFGDTGRVILNVQTAIPTGGIGLNGLRILSDGKILCAGYAQDRFFSARINSNGTPDATFGTNGITYLVPAIPNQVSYTNGTGTELSDGRMVLSKLFLVSGQATTVCLVLVNADGSFNSAVGTNGFLDSQGYASFSGFIASGDKILGIELSPDLDSVRRYIRRWNGNLSPDQSFGNQGRIRISGPNASNWVQLAAQSTGKWFLFGDTGGNFTFTLLRRYHSDFTLDTDFGQNGELRFRFSANNNNFQRANHLLMLQEGEVLTVGSSGNSNSPNFSAPILNYFVPASNVPKVSYLAPVLSSTGQGIFQWQRNNVDVGGATSNTYQPIQSGQYRVRLTDNKGCRIFSNSRNVTITSMDQVQQSGFRVFPSPASGALHIEVEPGMEHLELFDASCRKVLGLNMEAGMYTLPTNGLPKGAYLLRTIGSGKALQQRVLLD